MARSSGLTLRKCGRQAVLAREPDPEDRADDLVPSVLLHAQDLLIRPDRRAEGGARREQLRMAEGVDEGPPAAHGQAGDPPEFAVGPGPVGGVDMGDELLDEHVLVADLAG